MKWDRLKASKCWNLFLGKDGKYGIVCNHGYDCENNAKYVGDDCRFYCEECKELYKLEVVINKE